MQHNQSNNYKIIDTKKNKDKFITVREFSEITGIGQNTCYTMVNSDSFPKIKVGRKILIIKDRIDSWINDNIGNEF